MKLNKLRFYIFISFLDEQNTLLCKALLLYSFSHGKISINMIKYILLYNKNWIRGVKMKKTILLILAILTMVACGKKEADKNILYIFNWSDYMPQEVLDDFYKETGIKVIQDSYSSNEEMYAKVAAGGTGYDLLFPSADFQEIMIKQDMIQKLDKTLLPNIKEQNRISEALKKIDDKICLNNKINDNLPHQSLMVA